MINERKLPVEKQSRPKTSETRGPLKDTANGISKANGSLVVIGVEHGIKGPKGRETQSLHEWTVP